MVTDHGQTDHEHTDHGHTDRRADAETTDAETDGESGGEASREAGDRQRVRRADAAVARSTRIPAAGTLAALGLAWLLLMLAASRTSPGAGGEAWTVLRAAHYLPQLVSASLVGGIAVGVAGAACADRFAVRVRARLVGRLAVAAGGGVLVAAAAAVPLSVWYQGLPFRSAFAGTVALAALLGGLLTVARRPVVPAAGAGGALAVFAVGLVEGILEEDLWQAFGAADAPESVLSASNWTVLTAALVAGVVAGLLVFAYLRRGAPQARWPAYLAGGALPGLLVLGAEALTRIGGTGLFATVDSGPDQLVLEFLNTTRIDRGLLVLFAGALTALLLFGRTLSPGDDPQSPKVSNSDGSYQASS